MVAKASPECDEQTTSIETNEILSVDWGSMTMLHPSSLACQHRRRGGVTLQVLVTIAAMAAGVWLGSEYLGVPVNDLAYTALDETNMLQQVPDEWRPNKPGCETGDCEEPTPEERAKQLADELTHLRAEAAALREAAAGNLQALETVLSAEVLQNNKQRRARTIAYWERLCEIAKSVTYLHDEVAVSGDAQTTGHVLDLRRRAFEYGQRAIAAIPFEHVDDQAVDSGQRLAAWYANGAKLYGQASSLWDGNSAETPASLNEASLARAQKQHHQEAQLIHDKAGRVSEVLSRRYVVEFPKLGA